MSKPKPQKPTPQPERSLDDLAREYMRERDAYRAVDVAWKAQAERTTQARVALNLAMHRAGVAAVVINQQCIRISNDGFVSIDPVHVVSPESPQ